MNSFSATCEPLVQLPDDLFTSRLSNDDGAFLIREFSEDEIKRAVWDCDGSKSPGPDSFNMSFYKHCWEIIRPDLLKVFADFHAHGRLVRGSNPSYIALIPKKEGAHSLNNFRPISLIGSLYKILAKVLAARLKSVLGSIIGESQSAFLKGRFILDGVVALNEAIEDAKKSKARRLIFKVDFAKAFDSISWDYLLDIKRKLNFPAKWITWIHSCLSTAKANVLVNGSPSGEFDLHRGIRQGDPLSPFLFLVAAEGLNLMTKRAIARNLLKPSVIGKNKVPLSHLQYADDTIFIVEGNPDNAKAIRWLLHNFQIISGLSVNFDKCSIFGINMERNELSSMAQEFGCQLGNLPIPYLGVKVGGRIDHSIGWDDIIQKTRKKIQQWDVNGISLAGRITIVRSVLSALPIYTLSFRPIPKKTFISLKRIFSNFLWGGKEGSNKIAWVKWEDLCLSKACGGLGLLNLLALNNALLCKWVWRFISGEEHLWKKLIVSRHGEPTWDLNGVSNSLTWSTCSGWWRRISKLVDGDEGAEFWGLLERKLGNGENTNFWRHVWSGTSSLHLRFPRLYHLSANKDATISEMGFWANGLWNWNLEWRRPLRSPEMAMVDELLHQISTSTLLEDQQDRWIWKHKSSETSLVKHLYTNLHTSSLGNNSHGQPSNIFKNLWKASAPFKHQVLGWRVIRNRLPTVDNLRKRNISLTTALNCCFCDEEEETCRHLFLSCSKVRRVWDDIIAWIGIPWVPPGNLIDHAQSFSFILGRGKIANLLFGLWTCIVWVWWKWRNTIRFENKEADHRKIVEEIKSRSWNWCTSQAVPNTPSSYMVWSSSFLSSFWN